MTSDNALNVLARWSAIASVPAVDEAVAVLRSVVAPLQMGGPVLEHERMRDGFDKYHANPRGELDWPFRPVFHRLRRPDTTHPHDHHASIRAHVVEGSYIEHIYEPQGRRLVHVETAHRRTGDTLIIPAGRIHRIVALPDGECWTLCCYGPPEREACFWRDEAGRVEWRPIGQAGVWRAWQPAYERPAAEAAAREQAP